MTRLLANTAEAEIKMAALTTALRQSAATRGLTPAQASLMALCCTSLLRDPGCAPLRLGRASATDERRRSRTAAAAA